MAAFNISRIILIGLFVEFLGGAVLSSSMARAEGDASGKKSKKTTVNFEDQLIEGQAQKPELFYLLQQRNANFKKLIILRNDFLPEMRKSAEEITRKGSGQ